MISEIIEWIETNKFTKPTICGCDFEGNWLGDGKCVGCGHPIEYFYVSDYMCQYPRERHMDAREMKEEILNYLRGLV